MNDAVRELYASFSHYRIGDDFFGCDCCISSQDSAKLVETPLGDLTYEDLERYSSKAISTWGTARHFKHFLPRLLELAIEHRDDFLDLAVVFGKLKYAEWYSWPDREQRAIGQFFDDYWQYQLADPIVGPFEDAIDTVLCALSNACKSVQPYLDTWLCADTDNARRHFAAFVLQNESSLLKKGCLWNAFWDTNGESHREVIHWLQSQAALDYFGEFDDVQVDDDFSFAGPQFLAIRASLAEVSG